MYTTRTITVKHGKLCSAVPVGPVACRLRSYGWWPGETASCLKALTA